MEKKTKNEPKLASERANFALIFAFFPLFGRVQTEKMRSRGQKTLNFAAQASKIGYFWPA